MGRPAELDAARHVATEAVATGEGATALALAGPLGRLTGEAEVVERLLAHIGDEFDEARAALEHLERCCASVEQADRAPSQALLAAEAAAIESRFTRLRAAAALAKAFARLRASEAEALKGEAGAVKTEAGDPSAGWGLRHAS